MTKGAINDFTSSYATYIIVVIYVCRKLHWFRPDLSDLVLGVFSSPVRFVIIELDLSHFHELMRDREISKIYYPFPWFVFLFLNFNLSLFKGEKKIPCASTSSTLVQHVRRWSASTDWVKKVSGTIGSLILRGSRPPPPPLPQGVLLINVENCKTLYQNSSTVDGPEWEEWKREAIGWKEGETSSRWEKVHIYLYFFC